MIVKSSGFLFIQFKIAFFVLAAIIFCLDSALRTHAQEVSAEVPSVEEQIEIVATPEVVLQPSNEIVLPPQEDLENIASNDPRIKSIDPEKVESPKLNLYSLSVERYSMYRREEDAVAYMPGNGEQFGWLSFASSNYLSSRKSSGLSGNINIHLLSGPNSIAMPPRLYDFELGYQSRRSLSERFSYDWSVMAGIYSDFEDSARDGVRFPSHAVGIFHQEPRADWVFGVDYLGRDDIKLLPVLGLCWHDPDRPAWRYQWIFPRPRVDLTLSEKNRVYCGGTLGGGTWDIEFPDDSNDVMTYRDYKFVLGFEQTATNKSLSAWELGWVFNRRLEFRSRPDERSFDDAFVLRYVSQR